MDTSPTTPLARAAQFNQDHPLLSFTILAATFSWLVWLLAWPFGQSDPIAFRHLIALGFFGPSLAGALLTYLLTTPRPAIRWDWFMLAVLVIGVLYILCLPYASSLSATVSSIGWAARIALWVAPALLIAFSLSDQDHLRRLLLPTQGQKALTAWYAVALLLFPLVFGLGYAFSLQTGDAAPLSLKGGPAEIALTISASFIYMLLFGGALGEEAGLRGFALPRLQQKFSPLLAALVLALAWLVWTLPLYLNGYNRLAPDNLLENLLGRLALTLLLMLTLAWLYNRSQGNLLACVLLHGSYTTSSVLLPPGWPTILVLTIVALGLLVQAKMWVGLPANDQETV